MRKKKKLKVKWKNLFLLLILLFASILIILSIYNGMKWYFDNIKLNKQIDNINDKVNITIKEDNENTEIINQDKDIPREDPYWDYIKMNLIDIDFKELKKINKDTVGWIQVNGTNINYPFVQGNDNSYYLNHDINKKSNGGGWVFLDYRNNINELDKNTVIYAHGRQNKTMFGSLKNILTSGWLENNENFVIKLSTATENTLWQVFSVYRIPTTSDYLQIEFKNDFNKFSEMLINRSAYNFNTSLNESDKILTLSTCYDDNDKVVLHAKLIKKEKKID